MKKMGILGLGISGQSILNFFSEYKKFKIQAMDLKYPDQLMQDFMQKNNIEFILQNNNIKEFFEYNDYIVPSPGVNLNNYSQYHYKIVPELDIFYKNWHKKIIAITGSIGKTSVTHLIGQILKNAGLKICVAGNIGLPMLDIISHQDSIDYAILEVSSFQLEFCKYFAPDIAIWTNLFENHLDRHISMENYFAAKTNILKYQKANQVAILNSDLRNWLKNINLVQQVCWISNSAHTLRQAQGDRVSTQGEMCVANDEIHSDNGWLRSAHAEPVEALERVMMQDLPDITFKSNWLIILNLCKVLNIDLSICLDNLSIPDHRLKLVANINNVSFYNDSKSTVPQSTTAAVEQLSFKPIYLLLGGLSKGIDREPFIKDLNHKVKFIACFGKEAHTLYEQCKKYLIPSDKFETLDAAFNYCVLNAKSEEQVLLSPAGSSYDLFKDYQERGNHFLSLVYAWEKNNDKKVSN